MGHGDSAGAGFEEQLEAQTGSACSSTSGHSTTSQVLMQTHPQLVPKTETVRRQKMVKKITTRNIQFSPEYVFYTLPGVKGSLIQGEKMKKACRSKFSAVDISHLHLYAIVSLKSGYRLFLGNI